MTACATEAAAEGEATEEPRRGPATAGPDGAAPGALTLTADGSYAARLAGTGEAHYVERWTLGGPEPYAVPLPLDQPEEAHTAVQPLADGRVLVVRRAAGRSLFSLLYPTGPTTGQVHLGAVTGPVVLLPPCPDGVRAYALTPGAHATGVWLVAGGAPGPQRVAVVPGRCSGGAWLDRAGRMLALDRRLPEGGPVKAVSVDLARGGEVAPLLQIAESSDDRLLLADPDSGLIVVRSDAPAPGRDRLGWGVLGSLEPVRFPESLRLPDAVVTPFALQPGQALAPEDCALAVRIDGASGSWVGAWSPAARRLHQLAPPEGWLAGTGSWGRDGRLHLPYTTGQVPCGVAHASREETFGLGGGRGGAPATAGPAAAAGAASGASAGTAPTPCAAGASPGASGAGGAGGPGRAEAGAAGACRPVPLQQAPLTGRVMHG
ncbi:hypothetical protein [Streptomyces sp. NPDC047968]|uniref:hypothetical protein n=1 Tax=unclassified Streptomyces TaxID=2593676 RepID=UPI003439922A